MSEIPDIENEEARIEYAIKRGEMLEMILGVGWLADTAEDILNNGEDADMSEPPAMSEEEERKMFNLFKYGVLVGMDGEYYNG